MHLPNLSLDMDFKTYLADPMETPSLTSSLVRALLTKAPRKVWTETPRLNKNAESENKTQFDLGSAAHRLFTGVGEPIMAIDAKDFRGKAAQQARDEAYSSGKTPILKDNLAIVQDMVGEAWVQILDNPTIGHLFTKENSAKILRESSIFWNEAGANCRCRPDFYAKSENIMIHYKTTATAISPYTLGKFAANSQWDHIAAHYAAGGKALTGHKTRQIFVIQELAKPHLLLVAELDNEFIDTAAMRRERALMIWTRCLRENAWPGMASRTLKLECPPWHANDAINEKDAEEAAANAGTDLLDMMRKWQAPEGWQPAAVQGAVSGDERDVIE